MQYSIALVFLLMGGYSGQVHEHGEISTDYHARSVVLMDRLLSLSEELVLNIEQYTSALEEKLKVIRTGLVQMIEWYEVLGKDNDSIAINPFYIIAIIRRMYSDWKQWQLYLEKSVGTAQLQFLQLTRSELPTSEDLDDAVSSMIHIYDVYNLNIKDMAMGILDGVQYKSSKLLPIDYFYLAEGFASQEYYAESEEWLEAALKAIEEGSYNGEMSLVHGLTTQDIFKALTNVRQKQNKGYAALEALDNVLQVAPHDVGLLQDHKQRRLNLLLNAEQGEEVPQNKLHIDHCCSGKCPRSPNRLTCHYRNFESPFLRLAPVKMEILSLSPLLVLYLDVITSKEQKYLRRISKPFLRTSSSYNAEEDTTLISDYRTAKSTWLSSNSTKVLQRIEHTVADLTDLNMTFSESYQIINYGLGGTFQRHIDLLQDLNERNYTLKERVATVLFFLSETTQGGALLFPHMNLTIYPKSGAALFWYNLDNIGENDLRVQHTGCPVIVGSKWIMTKWIHYLGQNFSCQPKTKYFYSTNGNK